MSLLISLLYFPISGRRCCYSRSLIQRVGPRVILSDGISKRHNQPQLRNSTKIPLIKQHQPNTTSQSKADGLEEKGLHGTLRGDIYNQLFPSNYITSFVGVAMTMMGFLCLCCSGCLFWVSMTNRKPRIGVFWEGMRQPRSILDTCYVSPFLRIEGASCRRAALCVAQNPSSIA